MQVRGIRQAELVQDREVWIGEGRGSIPGGECPDRATGAGNLEKEIMQNRKETEPITNVYEDAREIVQIMRQERGELP